MTSTFQRTAVVDFDNTIAGYDKWRGEDVLGSPVPYALDAILELMEWGWRVVVFTTRGDAARIAKWLMDYGFPPLLVNSTAHNPPNTSSKPIGEVYFDDRDAHCVGGTPYNWHWAMKRVRKLYQPPMDTHIDDASSWSSWWIEHLVAPAKRRAFVKSHVASFGTQERSEG